MCGCSATGKISPAQRRGCAYTRVCFFPRSQNLRGAAGSSDFRGCAPVALQEQGAHRNETVVRLGGGPRPKNSAVVRPAENGRPRPPPRILAENSADIAGRRSSRPNWPAELPAHSDTPPTLCASLKSKVPFLDSLKNMTLAVATVCLLCAPRCVGTAFCVHRLACGPLNNMTPAVATGRLLCAPPCVCTAFYVHRLACGPLNNMTPAVATGRLLCALEGPGGASERPGGSAGRIGQPTPPPSRTTGT